MMRRNRGFTLIELMIVVAIIGILAAIAIPNFIRFQARARQAEPNTNLKSLFTALRTQQRKPASFIHGVGFAPERGNRYSYHLDDSCANLEDRSDIDAVPHEDDTCIGADKFKFGTDYPDKFTIEKPTGQTWSAKARGHTTPMVNAAGTYGSEGNWDFLAYAAGDVDNSPGDAADTWLVSSSDGTISAKCPATTDDHVAAGEPYNVNNDVNCD